MVFLYVVPYNWLFIQKVIFMNLSLLSKLSPGRNANRRKVVQYDMINACMNRYRVSGITSVGA